MAAAPRIAVLPSPSLRRNASGSTCQRGPARPDPATAPAPAPAEGAGAGAVLARLIRQGVDWRSVVRYDDADRWFTRLGVVDGHEIWLLSWLAGQQSPLHDHGDSSGGFAVLDGGLDELVVHRDGTLVRRRWFPGAVATFGAEHVHRVGNDLAAPAVSLHAYTPRLRTMRRWTYDDGALTLVGTERAGADW